MRYRASDLIQFATALLNKAGLDLDKSKVVAETLVEADLLGHTTHGLALLAPYLDSLNDGMMTKTGEPCVLADFPAAINWDGQLLPGPWLVHRAIDVGIGRARINGTCTITIRKSHHIACLEAYLKRVTDQGLVILLMCSDPVCKGVAPFGGKTDVYTPNPIAAGWPTDSDPVMLDVSMSITALAVSKRLASEGKKFPGQWALDADGNPTDDPAVLYRDPHGSLLPIGGVDHGHKGYALGLLVEALTGGLCGFGRADAHSGWSANVFLQILDPKCFGGRDEFCRQMQWLTDACRNSPPRAGVDRVRLPGEAALQKREEQLSQGVDLHNSIMPSLEPWAAKLRVTAPSP